ncbi:hypothetical protein ABZS66_59865 [Dactylosporangium sp. NPDC005572]
MTEPTDPNPDRTSRINWVPALALITYAVGILAGIIDGIGRP